MRQAWIAGWAAGLGLLIAALLQAPFLGDRAVTYVSDLGQLGAAVAASAGCASAARRTTAHRSRAWLWASVGTGGWAAGQAVWSWYELALGREVPFPSPADAGFLLFPVAMAVGLVTWLGSQGQLVARGRDLLDGAIIAGSLLVLSWVTAVGSVVSAGADSWLPLVLSLAYPVGDLIVATLVLLALARGRGAEQASLVVLALGLGGLAFSDSAYVYLVGVGDYSSADVVSSGWVVGFLLVAAAGLGAPAPAVESVRPRPDSAPPVSSPAESGRLRLLLPYLPLGAAGTVLVSTLLRSATTPTVDLLLGVVLVVLVLARQFLAMLDNHRLLGALGTARDQLQHQATHDALTGLPNRTLFATRLHRALERPGHEVSVLFCDLDDFKLVNDRHGHHVGDELLQIVARRLLQAVRESDTVARLGGDEFAILVESDQAVLVADRVVELLARPVELRGWVLATSASVGIAHHRDVEPLKVAPRADGPTSEGPTYEGGPAGRRARSAPSVPASASQRQPQGADQESLATLLLRRADIAMYAAKEAGKGRAVLDEVPRLAV